MKIQFSKRMEKLAPYLFADLDRKKNEAKAKGVDVISLTIGDPDIPTPEEIVKAGQKALSDPATHRYPSYSGSPAFRKAAASWMNRRFNVSVDPDRDLVVLTGTKEGIAHLPMALVDPGDVVLCPDPGYPVYSIATQLCGGEVFYLPLKEERAFLPDLDSIPDEVAIRSKALWVNYPNNPTAAIADLSFFERSVDFCRKHNCLLCVDSAYSEITFDGYQANSVFQVPGAMDVAVEFHSLSKTYNMCGWRVGFAVGQREAIGALARLKSNLDSGVFQAVQLAGITAMEQWPRHLPALLETYRRRRDVMVNGLREAGFQVSPPKATFYIWMSVPGGDDREFAAKLIEKTGVLVAPGSGFGPSGKGYVRFALTVPEPRLKEAAERIRKAKMMG
jgi:LL-diaminopimelate aminotransferase